MSNLIFSLNAAMPIFLTMILGLFFRKLVFWTNRSQAK